MNILTYIYLLAWVRVECNRLDSQLSFSPLAGWLILLWLRGDFREFYHLVLPPFLLDPEPTESGLFLNESSLRLTLYKLISLLGFRLSPFQQSIVPLLEAAVVTEVLNIKVIDLRILSFFSDHLFHFIFGQL